MIADAAHATEIGLKLRALEAQAGTLHIGHEGGAGFWRRFELNAATLVRVAERDSHWAALMRERERREVLRRAALADSDYETARRARLEPLERVEREAATAGRAW